MKKSITLLFVIIGIQLFASNTPFEESKEVPFANIESEQPPYAPNPAKKIVKKKKVKPIKKNFKSYKKNKRSTFKKARKKYRKTYRKRKDGKSFWSKLWDFLSFVIIIGLEVLFFWWLFTVIPPWVVILLIVLGIIIGILIIMAIVEFFEKIF